LTEIKQILNILLKNVNKGNPLLYTPLGKSGVIKMDTLSHKNYLVYGLMNWRGVSLICTVGATWKPFVNIDVQNSAILVGQDVLDTIGEVFVHPKEFKEMDLRKRPANMAKATNVGSWSFRDFDNVMELLRSCKIRRRVMNRNSRTVEKRDARLDGICGFGNDKGNSRFAQQIMFEFEGRQISVADYFARVLGTPLRYPLAPVLILGKKNKVPAEFCTIKEGQSINRLLPSLPQTRMLRQCSEKPHEKYRSIDTFIDDLDLEDHPLLKSFGVNCPTSNMLGLTESRILPAPELVYGKQDVGSFVRGKLLPTGGIWDMWNTTVKFYDPAQIDYLAFVHVGVEPNRKKIDALAEVLVEEGELRGMIFPGKWSTDFVSLDRNMRYDVCVKAISNKFTQLAERTDFSKERCLYICIIPSRSSQEYAQVKQASELLGKASVLTQCVQEKNLSNKFGQPDRSIARNLLLKINAKMRGINHVPLYPEPLLENVSILRVPTLIIGIDVTHATVPQAPKNMTPPQRGSKNPNNSPKMQDKMKSEIQQPSFASVTGSLDRSGMPYMMAIQAQAREGFGQLKLYRVWMSLWKR
jgi:eukaryotic translation initiation factor 2C